MLRHTLSTIFRRFNRDRVSFFVSLTGLSIALATAFVVTIWVRYETGIDAHDHREGLLYQVFKNSTSGNGVDTYPYTPGRLAETLSKDIPEVVDAVAVIPPSRFATKGMMSLKDRHVRATGQCATRNFFDVFRYQPVAGSLEHFGSEKYGVAISEDVARSLFNSAPDAVGATIRWTHDILAGEYTVVAVFQDRLMTSDPGFDILFPFDLYLQQNPKLENWSNGDPSTFVVLKEQADVRAVAEKISGVVQSRVERSNQSFILQQYSERYLYNQYENGKPVGGRIFYVRLFVVASVLIIVIACINFTNLSVARSLRLSKVTGVKKVLGIRSQSLFLQQVTEPIVLSLISAGVAAGLVFVMKEWLSSITGIPFTPDTPSMACLILIAIATGVMAGIYPAAKTIRLKAIEGINGIISRTNSGLTRTLVVIQFVVTAVFMIAAVIIHDQVTMMRTRSQGFNRDYLIHFEKGMTPGLSGEAAVAETESLLQEIKNIPGVINASNFRHSILDRKGGTTDLSWPGKPTDDRTEFTDFSAGYDFIETMQIDLLEGRSFSHEQPDERSRIILNEKAVQVMGLADPVGTTVRLWGEEREIIGVVKDFHFRSVQEPIQPMFFELGVNPRVSRVMVRVAPDAVTSTLDRIKQVYGTFYPGLAFDFTFLNDDHASLYASEKRFEAISGAFTMVAIITACLGLFSLAAYAVETRMKEFSIRKIVGASGFTILLMLSGYFARIILVSFIIATPVAYYISGQWLGNFAYRIDVTPWHFVNVLLAMIAVSALTVAAHSLKAARANPVSTLRSQ